MSLRWTKRILPEDEDDWNERLALRFPGQYVITRQAGNKTLNVEVFPPDNEMAESLKREFGGAIDTLKQEDWAESRDAKPLQIKIRDRLLVTSKTNEQSLSTLRNAHPARALLSIPPALAFGTGDHATTANCLRFLVDTANDYQASNWSLLDLGTGTGILAIAAKMLGATRVEGWENDPLAVDVAKANVTRHGFSEAEIAIANADALAWQPKVPEWDVITANMFSEILMALFPKIRPALRPEGKLIISGILESQAHETMAAAEKSGFAVMEIKQRGPWIAGRLC